MHAVAHRVHCRGVAARTRRRRGRRGAAGVDRRLPARGGAGASSGATPRWWSAGVAPSPRHWSRCWGARARAPSRPWRRRCCCATWWTLRVSRSARPRASAGAMSAGCSGGCSCSALCPKRCCRRCAASRSRRGRGAGVRSVGARQRPARAAMLAARASRSRLCHRDLRHLDGRTGVAKRAAQTNGEHPRLSSTVSRKRTERAARQCKGGRTAGVAELAPAGAAERVRRVGVRCQCRQPCDAAGLPRVRAALPRSRELQE